MTGSIWNSLISKLPNSHFLQTYEWGQVKARYGWSPLYAVWDSDGKWNVENDPGLLSTLREPQGSAFNFPVAAALILKRRIFSNGFAGRLSILYSPKGPLFDWSNESLRGRVLNDLQIFTKREGAIFFKMDPDVLLGTGIPGSGQDTLDNSGQSVLSELQRRGWRSSADQIQFKNTLLIDLKSSEEELLAQMKQKTRYNIRLADRKGVSLRVGNIDDLPMLYKMYAETSLRDGFVIRDEAYYKTVWTAFMTKAQSPVSNLPLPGADYQLLLAEPLIAEVNHEPMAAIFVFYFADRAYYVYGMSRNAHREKMPAYLLQWEAMKRAKARGCDVYDLWGAPDVFVETDPMWGVFRFKAGLGGKVVRTLGAWDFAPNPFWYEMYSEIIPRLLDVMRARGNARTRQQLGA